MSDSLSCKDPFVGRAFPIQHSTAVCYPSELRLGSSIPDQNDVVGKESKSSPNGSSQYANEHFPYLAAFGCPSCWGGSTRRPPHPMDENKSTKT